MLNLSNKVKRKIQKMHKCKIDKDNIYRYERSSLILSLDKPMIYVYPDKVNKIFYLTILKHCGVKHNIRWDLPSEILNIVVSENELRKTKDFKRFEIIDELFIQASIYLWKIMKDKCRS